MSRTAVIVQARTGSTRLPGKVCELLAGETVLGHVLRRALAVRTADVVCLATTDLPQDNDLADLAASYGVEFYRGSSDDVLDRYLCAARVLDADVILRITCDCPVIDPTICDEVLQLRQNSGADYATNINPPGWPHGLDCEAFTREALETAAELSRTPREREHVTPWIRNNTVLHHENLSGPSGDVTSHRWTLDYPEDLTFFEELFRHLPAPPAMPGWQEILDVVERHPEITALNAMRVDPTRRANHRHE